MRLPASDGGSTGFGQAAAGSAENPEGAMAVRVVPKIYYSSRTHSQLKQVVKELKATGYQISSTALGSRDQLCVNRDVNQFKGSQCNAMCRKYVAANACSYHKKTKFDRGKDQFSVSGNLCQRSVQIINFSSSVINFTVFLLFNF